MIHACNAFTGNSKYHFKFYLHLLKIYTSAVTGYTYYIYAYTTFPMRATDNSDVIIKYIYFFKYFKR